MNIPLPWHLDVYIIEDLPASLSRVVFNCLVFAWTTSKRSHIRSALGMLAGGSRISLIRCCCLACRGLACTFLDFCWAYLYGKVKSSLENGWLSRLEAAYASKTPNLSAISRTTSHSNHPHQFISTLGQSILCKRNCEKTS